MFIWRKLFTVGRVVRLLELLREVKFSCISFQNVAIREHEQQKVGSVTIRARASSVGSGRAKGLPFFLYNPLSANTDRQQFSPNSVHTLSSDEVMRINKLIVKEKMS